MKMTLTRKFVAIVLLGFFSQLSMAQELMKRSVGSYASMISISTLSQLVRSISCASST